MSTLGVFPVQYLCPAGRCRNPAEGFWPGTLGRPWSPEEGIRDRSYNSDQGGVFWASDDLSWPGLHSRVGLLCWRRHSGSAPVFLVEYKYQGRPWSHCRTEEPFLKCLEETKALFALANTLKYLKLVHANSRTHSWAPPGGAFISNSKSVLTDWDLYVNANALTTALTPDLSLKRKYVVLGGSAPPAVWWHR